MEVYRQIDRVINDNAFKEETKIIYDMIDEDQFNEDWEKYKKSLYHVMSVNPEEDRSNIGVRMRKSYHKVFSYYAALNGLTIGEFYEKAAIFYMKTHPHPRINAGDVLDKL